MARHRRFSLEFKRQVVLDFLEKRLGLRELSRKHKLSRNLLSQWVRKYETGLIFSDKISPICLLPTGNRSAERLASVALS
jgi:transposase-like protein